ncbi:antitoxin YezG family protein [Bacillus siamensis]|uniref:antitoxin YezG family protein n=1 Tax=Bacillus siamensis TaxID=659243 RepID=UPI0022323BDA|nr:antitoxin YezG family protein [Bacillus siamensis]UZD74845.1 antitoxin YezG family protein [Bacillus siamensis]
MGQFYQRIAEHLNEMIPSEWTKIVLYAEILDDSSEVYFFFNTLQSEENIYSHDIPKQFDVSKKIYVSLLIELQELFEELREEFKANNQDIWTNLTLKLENTGKSSIDYDYTDVIASDLNGTQRQVIWEYQNLGILPEDESDKEFVINYFGL